MKQLIRYIRRQKLQEVYPEVAHIPDAIERIVRNLNGKAFGSDITNAAMPFLAWHIISSRAYNRPNLGLWLEPNEVVYEVANSHIPINKAWAVFRNGELYVIHQHSWKSIYSLHSAMSAMNIKFDWEHLYSHFDWEETEDKFNLWSTSCQTRDEPTKGTNSSS